MNLDIEKMERVRIKMEGILRETAVEFHATIAETIDSSLNRGTRIRSNYTMRIFLFPPHSNGSSLMRGWQIRANHEIQQANRLTVRLIGCAHNLRNSCQIYRPAELFKILIDGY